MAINNVDWEDNQAMTFTKFQGMQDDSINGFGDLQKGDDIHKQYVGSDFVQEANISAFLRLTDREQTIGLNTDTVLSVVIRPPFTTDSMSLTASNFDGTAITKDTTVTFLPKFNAPFRDAVFKVATVAAEDSGAAQRVQVLGINAY